MDDNLSRNQSKAFVDIKIGDMDRFEIVIDENIHNAFASLSGDTSPIHCSNEFSKNSRFGKRIGYAFLLGGLLSRFYGEFLPGGSSICIKQESKFIKPYYIGDRLTVVGEVIGKIDSTQFIEIKTEIFREEKECIFKGIGIVQIAFDKKYTTPLYLSGSGKIYFHDIVSKLKSIGVNQGDKLFIHSDISVFGRLNIFDRNVFLNILLDAFKEVVGSEGTLIMPTFSYSFCKGEVFDIKNTKSTVGVFTEFFRKSEDVARTAHPIFSSAVWGEDKNEFLNISKDSFDEESIFGKLNKKRVKLIFLGAPFHSCTFIHFIEQSKQIPYRYFKSFNGKIIDGESEYDDEYTYYVRKLEENSVLNTERLEQFLLENNLLKKVNLGDGKILSIDAHTLFENGIELLNQNPKFFLKEDEK